MLPRRQPSLRSTHRTRLKAFYCASERIRDTRRSSRIPSEDAGKFKKPPIPYPASRRWQPAGLYSLIRYWGVRRGNVESSNILIPSNRFPCIWGKCEKSYDMLGNLAYGVHSIPWTASTFQIAGPVRHSPHQHMRSSRNLAYHRITRISNNTPYLNKKILCKSLQGA